MASRNSKATRISTTINVAVSMTPIDIIDLTADSGRHAVLRRPRRRIENPPYQVPNNSSQSTRTQRRACRHRSVPTNDCITDDINEPEAQHVSDEQQNSIIEVDEVINLDDTEPNIVPCINDSCSGQSRVLTCPICYEELCNKLQPTSTRCGHIFCAGCLEKAIKATKKCPLCKRNVQLRGCTRLHF